MAGDKALVDVYRRFERIWADSQTLVQPTALAAAIGASRVGLDDVTDDWLRALDRDWVYGHGNRPFRDEELNRRYWRAAAS